MKNRKNALCAFSLVLAMLTGLLAGCGAAPAPAETPAQESEERAGFTVLDSELIRYLEENGYREKSYLVSPLSLKAALALAAAGAEGDTRAELLQALGFADEEALLAWYDGVKALSETTRFEKECPVEAALFVLANSIWHNADKEGAFRPEYVQKVGERLGAEAKELPGAELAGAVNDWVKEQTHGLIPQIVEDLSNSTAALVNTLYLMSAWTDSFDPEATAPGLFTTLTGEQVERELMHRTTHCAYYEDEGTQLIVLPMEGGLRMAFVLGGTDGLTDKLGKAERAKVEITLPRFEVETALDDNELVELLRQLGVEKAFTDEADFSGMSDESWAIGEIVQKTRLKLDEEGVEAAAATAIIMVESAMPAEPTPEPLMVFTADRPFSFCIYAGEGETAELLFYGQYVG